MTYENILIETRGKVGLITLNRPEAYNALNTALMTELIDAITKFDQDRKIGCIILTGSEKAFAAGADIKEMLEKNFVDTYLDNYLSDWEMIAATRKPVIAAVAGYAFGGGCEIAMMCDFIIAADNAQFGQPEIKLGVIPGAGGSQRLARSIGKSKAMEMCLTGRTIKADEAERCGLVSRIVPVDELMEEAMKAAETIADLSLQAVLMTKEAVNRSFDTTLSEGIRFEKRLFHSLFATSDQVEGMNAFVEKREPQFEDK